MKKKSKYVNFLIMLEEINIFSLVLALKIC